MSAEVLATCMNNKLGQFNGLPAQMDHFLLYLSRPIMSFQFKA